MDNYGQFFDYLPFNFGIVLDQPVISSTLLLTLLLMVGLFFFIRASIKDRTEQIELLATEPEESVFAKLQDYFEKRSYQITNVDGVNNAVTYQGFVPPSGFLSVFLSLLAGLGLLCIALVLGMLFPSVGYGFMGLLILAPAAGVFYWNKAGKTEKIILQITRAVLPEHEVAQRITITAHRDELIQLRQIVPYRPYQF